MRARQKARIVERGHEGREILGRHVDPARGAVGLVARQELAAIVARPAIAPRHRMEGEVLGPSGGKLRLARVAGRRDPERPEDLIVEPDVVVLRCLLLDLAIVGVHRRVLQRDLGLMVGRDEAPLGVDEVEDAHARVRVAARPRRVGDLAALGQPLPDRLALPARAEPGLVAQQIGDVHRVPIGMGVPAERQIGGEGIAEADPVGRHLEHRNRGEQLRDTADRRLGVQIEPRRPGIVARIDRPARSAEAEAPARRAGEDHRVALETPAEAPAHHIEKGRRVEIGSRPLDLGLLGQLDPATGLRPRLPGGQHQARDQEDLRDGSNGSHPGLPSGSSIPQYCHKSSACAVSWFSTENAELIPVDSSQAHMSLFKVDVSDLP